MGAGGLILQLLGWRSAMMGREHPGRYFHTETHTHKMHPIHANGPQFKVRGVKGALSLAERKARQLPLRARREVGRNGLQGTMVGEIMAWEDNVCSKPADLCIPCLILDEASDKRLKCVFVF